MASEIPVMPRFLALVLALLTAGVANGAAPVAIGSKVPNLKFKDSRYLSRSLDDFPSAKVFVLAFTETGCPLVQRYLPVLKKLEQDYRDRSVQFLAVNVSEEDAITAVAAQAVRFEIPFPFVKDFDHASVAALGIEHVPTVVVLDAKRVLRYRGRIDDQYRLGGQRPAPSRLDLKEALDAVLAEREVEVKETPVDGCKITKPELPKPEKPITFTEHIAPLLQKHCQECHRPGAPAPFSLLDYREVRRRADTIALVVREERMPPWYGASEHTEFVNRRGMTAKERELVRQWAKAGAPEGDMALLPPPRAWPDDKGWLIGKPDLIVQTEVHQIPAEGDVPYKYVVLPHLFTEETWVRSVQILPDNPRVLHHCNMAYFTLAEGFKMANFITGQVPGGIPMALEDGTAVRLPKGAMLALQIHYITTGKPEKCRVSVGFKYANGVIDKRLKFHLLANHRFAIPPGDPFHEVTASRVFEQDVVGGGLFCHMHVRGKDMTFKVTYPDGKNETLLVIPNYNFEWQIGYKWDTGKKRFPKGTRLEVVAHYDNSPFNPFNPDPKATVREGDQTHQEMMNGFFFYVDAAEKLNLDIDPKTGRVKKDK
jgi:thiol-disulfide isomerase/thioredoxin